MSIITPPADIGVMQRCAETGRYDERFHVQVAYPIYALQEVKSIALVHLGRVRQTAHIFIFRDFPCALIHVHGILFLDC